tara:strand:- start:73 stop:621 length:549 start_codon:yes stop_codon:yes gene_type:complete
MAVIRAFHPIEGHISILQCLRVNAGLSRVLDLPARLDYDGIMDIRPLSPTYAVSPQIAPEDVAAIAAAGYTTIICNRPDSEVPPALQAAALGAAAQAAGLAFVTIPVTHQTLNADMVTAQRAAMDASNGPVLAYCASGTRSSIVWSLGQAGEMSADAILSATAEAGYDLGGMRPQLAALSRS